MPNPYLVNLLARESENCFSPYYKVLLWIALDESSTFKFDFRKNAIFIGLLPMVVVHKNCKKYCFSL